MDPPHGPPPNGTPPNGTPLNDPFFVLRQFDDVLIYLSSVEAYFPSDPTFLYNYAIARAAAGKYKEAEPALLALQVRQPATPAGLSPLRLASSLPVCRPLPCRR